MENEHAGYPFVISYETENATVKYLAAEHTVDIESKTFNKIEIEIKTFAPDLVIVEGFECGLISEEMFTRVVDRCITSSNKEFFGCPEIFYSVFLAHEKGIPSMGAELLDNKVFIEYLKVFGYEKEDLLAFYFTRQLPQYFRNNKLHKEEDIPFLLLSYSGEYNWELPDFSYDSYKGWLTKQLGRLPPLSELTDQSAFCSPIKEGNNIQRLSYKTGEIRDKYMLHIILASLSNFKKVLVVFGGSHWLVQKETLKQHLEKGAEL